MAHAMFFPSDNEQLIINNANHARTPTTTNGGMFYADFHRATCRLRLDREVLKRDQCYLTVTTSSLGARFRPRLIPVFHACVCLPHEVRDLLRHICEDAGERDPIKYLSLAAMVSASKVNTNHPLITCVSSSLRSPIPSDCILALEVLVIAARARH